MLVGSIPAVLAAQREDIGVDVGVHGAGGDIWGELWEVGWGTEGRLCVAEYTCWEMWPVKCNR